MPAAVPVRIASISVPTGTPRRPLAASQSSCSANRAGATASWCGSCDSAATA